jgi:hypothetical protein
MTSFWPGSDTPIDVEMPSAEELARRRRATLTVTGRETASLTKAGTPAALHRWPKARY